MFSNWTRYLHKEQWFSLFLRLTLGSVFLIAGASKLPHGTEFSTFVVGYGLLPEGLAQVYAMLLPWTEIIVGSLLIMAILPRIASLLSIAIIASFITANIYVLASGSAGGMCGCFGEVIPLTHTQSLVANFNMLAISLLLLFRPSIKFNLCSVFRILTKSHVAISVSLVVVMVIMSLPAPALAANNNRVEIPAVRDIDAKIAKVNPDVTGDHSEGTVKPTLIYFYNEQCPSCMMQKPVIDAIEEEYGNNIIIERVNSQDNMRLLREYNITAVPTMIVTGRNQTNDSDSYQQFVGFTNSDILKESLDVPALAAPEVPSRDANDVPFSISDLSTRPLDGNQDGPLPGRFAAPPDGAPAVANLIAPTGQTLFWPSGATVATFGPNAGITIDMGTILWTGGCEASGGVDHWIYPYADVYIVPSGSVSEGSTLTDVGGTFNTVLGATGGIFISATIGYTTPSGSIGTGRDGIMGVGFRGTRFGLGTESQIRFHR